ncbi:MAG TPA: type I glyceraldehyde-3-phosphate dehydrogenase [Candidatus Fraserbacteria bacterium]|nr:type I glyceraldehyde-3-phosphate dehydrogenase [Candidatus Fraserbacteria bacterium]
MTKVAINGFGRTGRQILKAMLLRHPERLEIVAINDLASAKTNAHLFKHDSNYGRYPGRVEAKDDQLLIDDRQIQVLKERDPALLPWETLGVEIAIESTGLFRERALAEKHLQAGAGRVIISAPAKDEDLTIVMGVNEQAYDPSQHRIISNASCTTNCLAPLAYVLHREFGIEYGTMTTIHAYTNDQRLLDLVHKDLRRARAAAINSIPTTTGAAQAVERVIPELAGRFSGISVRVPVSTVSLVDFVILLKQTVSATQINEALERYAQESLKDILAVSHEPLVSSDFKGNSHSSIVDAPFTEVTGERLARVLAWYDNEWGYACRVADLAVYMGGKAA